MKKCNWIENDDGEGGTYSTSCNQEFTFIEGNPSDNGVKYCCYCGKRLNGMMTDKIREKFLEIISDSDIYRYGKEKRPSLPHEIEDTGCGCWILTDAGTIKARKLFKDMFPEDSCYEKDSGLIFI